MTITNLFSVLGGLALFLYGMNLLGASLEKCAGNRLKSILARLTKSTLRGFLLGAGITAVIQSSSATTVMAVGFVNSGLMTLRQSISIIIGANVGTTITAWILSLTGVNGGAWYVELLKPATFTPVIAFAGIVLFMSGKNRRRKEAAGVALGFAILMFGMEMMSNAVRPLADNPGFTRILTLFSNPILGILAGALITAAIQSSSASIGILQALSMTGAIHYSAALPIIMGMNIGASIPALLSSLGAGREARRASLVYLYFNLIGTAFWLPLIYALNAMFHFAAFDATAVPLGIAVVHTGFKLLCAALILPFSRQLEKLAVISVPEDDQGKASLLDERLFVTPSIALERAREVLLEMADISSKALTDALNMISDYDEKIAQTVVDAEAQADLYEDKLGTYLVKLSGMSMSEQDSHELTKYLHIISDYERISDHAINILESAQEKQEKGLRFSDQAWTELTTLSAAIHEILNISLAALRDDDLAAAARVEPLEQVVDDLTRRIKTRHINRLTRGECTIELGFLLGDLLANLERVSDHCSNVAVCVIEIAHNSFETHEYLHDHEDSREFQRLFESFQSQYALPSAD